MSKLTAYYCYDKQLITALFYRHLRCISKSADM